ncbi:MAG: ABC transporter permease [Thermoprotei archaeon]
MRLRRLVFANRFSAFGFVTVCAFCFLAFAEGVTGSRLTPYPFREINLLEANSPPSLLHPFGTNFEGSDILSLVLAALPLDIGAPLLIVLAASTIGLIVGTMAGYFRGWVEEVVMRLTDLFLAFPTFIMVLAVAATVGPSLPYAIGAIVAVWWPPYVRLVRGSVLSISKEDFVAISKTLNSRFRYILTKDIFPNVLPSLLVYATVDVGTALLSLSTLGYLGVGIPPQTPELGVMVASISNNLYTYPWEALLPALMVLLIVAGFGFLGEGLRETLDVKVRPHLVTRRVEFEQKVDSGSSPKG